MCWILECLPAPNVMLHVTWKDRQPLYAKDAPDGHELLVTRVKEGASICRECFYLLRGSFQGVKQEEMRATKKEHPVINDKLLAFAWSPKSRVKQLLSKCKCSGHWLWVLEAILESALRGQDQVVVISTWNFNFLELLNFEPKQSESWVWGSRRCDVKKFKLVACFLNASHAMNDAICATWCAKPRRITSTFKMFLGLFKDFTEVFWALDQIPPPPQPRGIENTQNE